MNPLSPAPGFLFFLGSKSADGYPFFYHGIRDAELGIILLAVQSIKSFSSATV